MSGMLNMLSIFSLRDSSEITTGGNRSFWLASHWCPPPRIGHIWDPPPLSDDSQNLGYHPQIIIFLKTTFIYVLHGLIWAIFYKKKIIISIWQNLGPPWRIGKIWVPLPTNGKIWMSPPPLNHLAPVVISVWSLTNKTVVIFVTW